MELSGIIGSVVFFLQLRLFFLKSSRLGSFSFLSRLYLFHPRSGDLDRGDFLTADVVAALLTSVVSKLSQMDTLGLIPVVVGAVEEAAQSSRIISCNFAFRACLSSFLSLRNFRLIHFRTPLTPRLMGLG